MTTKKRGFVVPQDVIDRVAREVFDFIHRQALEQGIDYVSSGYATSKEERVEIDGWLKQLEQEFTRWTSY